MPTWSSGAQGGMLVFGRKPFGLQDSTTWAHEFNGALTLRYCGTALTLVHGLILTQIKGDDKGDRGIEIGSWGL